MDYKLFLREEEKQELRKSHEVWYSCADVASLLPKMSSIVSLTEIANIKSKNTSYLQNDYFFCDVMLKFGRVNFHEFCDILQKDEKHKDFGQIFAKIVGYNVTSEVLAGAPVVSGNVTGAGGDGAKNRPTVERYEMKASTPKGIVFIIANYTDGLTGYTSDVINIQGFFKGKLCYEVVTEIANKKLENLTKEDFLEALKHMNQWVTMSGAHDRFYLFVLSHGNENGICTYKDDKTITTKEIIAYFQHDQMSCMKGLPKVFFFQACRGDKYVKTAGGSHSKKSPEKWEMPTEPIPTEADVMVCHSTTEEHFSFVGNCGSPFITESINAFEKYYKDGEDLGMIMREVKEKLSGQMNQVIDETDDTYEIVGEPGAEGILKRKHTGDTIRNGKVMKVNKGKTTKKAIKMEVWQMSTVTDNLTRKLLIKKP